MEKCYANKLYADRAGLTKRWAQGKQRVREDGWGSLGSGCQLLKEGELLGGEFPDASLLVFFESFESFRRGGTSESEVTPRPDPGRRGGHAPWEQPLHSSLGWGGGGRTAEALPPPPSRPWGGFLSPAPPPHDPHAWNPPTASLYWSLKRSGEPPLTGARSGVGGCVRGWGGRGCLLHSSSFVSASFTVWDTARGW